MELRRSPAPFLAVVAVLVPVGLGVWQAPGAIRRSNDQVAGVGRLTVEQRRLIPARAYDMATEIFVEAKRVIPPTDSYTVITGNGIEVSSPLTLFKAPSFALFFLMPRRYTGDVATADWIVSYGGDLQALERRPTRVIDVLPGLQIARLAR